MTPSNRKIQAVGIMPDVVIGEAEGEWYDENKKESSFIKPLRRLFFPRVSVNPTSHL
jgi:C-terminal processing protease CtpA/Prc